MMPRKEIEANKKKEARKDSDINRRGEIRVIQCEGAKDEKKGGAAHVADGEGVPVKKEEVTWLYASQMLSVNFLDNHI